MFFCQFYTHRKYLNWGGFNSKAIGIFIEYFSVATILMGLSVLGAFGLAIFLKNIKNRCNTSGRTVKVLEIENKNNESISYLFTYIIPFVFQDLSTIVNVVSITVLIIVTLVIYISSNMILINPTLSIKYTLYQVQYIDIESNKKRTGMFLTSIRYLEENDIVEIEDVGQKLFYAQTTREASC